MDWTGTLSSCRSRVSVAGLSYQQVCFWTTSFASLPLPLGLLRFSYDDCCFSPSLYWCDAQRRRSCACLSAAESHHSLCRGKFSMQIAAAAASQSALFPNLWLPSNDSGSVSIDACNPWHLPDSIHAHSLPHPSMPSTCSGSEFLTLHANTKRGSTKNRRVRQSKHYTKKHLQSPQFRNRNSHARTHFWYDDAFWALHSE